MFHVFFFFKQKTAYEMRISDWSSDVCSSDLHDIAGAFDRDHGRAHEPDRGANGFGRADAEQPDAIFVAEAVALDDRADRRDARHLVAATPEIDRALFARANLTVTDHVVERVHRSPAERHDAVPRRHPDSRARDASD